MPRIIFFVFKIKCEVSKFSKLNLLRGIQASFMNIEISIFEASLEAYGLCKYEKWRALPILYTQYIKFKSNCLINLHCNKMRTIVCQFMTHSHLFNLQRSFQKDFLFVSVMLHIF